MSFPFDATLKEIVREHAADYAAAFGLPQDQPTTVLNVDLSRERDGQRGNAIMHPMVIIRFPDDAAKRRALGWPTGRFSFKSWAGGQMLVPEAALGQLAMQGIPFISESQAASR